MNAVQQCLNLSPVPYLSLAFSIFRTIYQCVQDVQASQEELRVLVDAVAHLLFTVNRQYRDDKLLQDATKGALGDLKILLNEISQFIQKQCTYGFFKLLVFKEQRMAAIDEYHKRITTCITAFQISALVDIQHLQHLQSQARQADTAGLHEHLRRLEANQLALADALHPGKHSALAMMAALRRLIDEQKGDEEELQFFDHSLRYLMTTSGQRIDLRPWTITSLEVEFGPLIGSGGFAKVYRGRWNQMDVALKVMKNVENIVPSASSVKREVDAWSKLRHPHILQFLGANILDEEPFIVTPLIRHGNARDYLAEHKDCSVLLIIQHMSLGLLYLHSQHIAHGDLKAVNVLIEDGPKAVLCDFGLARIKADVNSRTTKIESNTIQGSQNWMAPELFGGSTLRLPCDIYSFGMTMYEMFTDEIPLGHVSPARLPELVVSNNVRPERPTEYEAPQLTDEIWKLAEECWVKDPASRLRASAVSERLSGLLSGSGIAETGPVPESISPPPLAASLPAKFSITDKPSHLRQKESQPSTKEQRPLPVASSSSSSTTSPPTFPSPNLLPSPPPTSRFRLPKLLSSGTVTSFGARAYTRWFALPSQSGNAIVDTAFLKQGFGEDPLLLTASESEVQAWDKNGVCQWTRKTPGLYKFASAKTKYAWTDRSEQIKLQHGQMLKASWLGHTEDEILFGLDMENWTLNWEIIKNHVRKVPLFGLRSYLESQHSNNAPNSGVFCAAISPNANVFYTGHEDGTIFISDRTNGQQARRPFHYPIEANSARFEGTFLRSTSCINLIARDNKSLLACYASGEIRLWDTKSGNSTVLREAVHPLSRPYDISPVAYSPDSAKLIMPSLVTPQTVEIRDPKTGTLLDQVYLKDCPEGRIFVVGVWPNYKRLWLCVENSTAAQIFVWE